MKSVNFFFSFFFRLADEYPKSDLRKSLLYHHFLSPARAEYWLMLTTYKVGLTQLHVGNFQTLLSIFIFTLLSTLNLSTPYGNLFCRHAYGTRHSRACDRLWIFISTITSSVHWLVDRSLKQKVLSRYPSVIKNDYTGRLFYYYLRNLKIF